MPTAVDRAEVLRLVREDNAQLVEVLPAEEFEDEHLDGALHLPLKAMTADGVAALDRGRPVIVYCWDAL